MLPTAVQPEEIFPANQYRQPWVSGHHFVRPNALFLGILTGFVVCCLLAILDLEEHFSPLRALSYLRKRRVSTFTRRRARSRP